MRQNNGYASNWVLSAYHYMQQCELDALKEIIDGLKPNSVCVNIGAGFGTSGMAFIESDTVGKLYTIDIYATEKESTLGNLEYEMGVFRQFGFDKDIRYKQILGDSIPIGKNWKYEKIDMLFIDGDHTYEHCWKDIQTWIPLIKPYGIMAFHDFEEPNWPGVGQAIKELLIPYSTVLKRAATFIAIRLGI